MTFLTFSCDHNQLSARFSGFLLAQHVIQLNRPHKDFNRSESTLDIMFKDPIQRNEFSIYNSLRHHIYENNDPHNMKTLP